MNSIEYTLSDEISQEKDNEQRLDLTTRLDGGRTEAGLITLPSSSQKVTAKTLLTANPNVLGDDIDVIEARDRHNYCKRILTQGDAIAKESLIRYQNKHQERMAWAYLLSEYDWNWYFTLTVKNYIPTFNFIKKFKIWKNMINRDLFGSNYHHRPEDGINWVLGIEEQARGVVHGHGLVHSRNNKLLMDWDVESGNKQRLHYMQKWEQVGKGFARVVPYRRAEEMKHSAESYISKYVAKGGSVLLDISRFSPDIATR